MLLIFWLRLRGTAGVGQVMRPLEQITCVLLLMDAEGMEMLVAKD